MSSSSTENGVHILIFPYPAQGHMLPLLDLTHHLSRRGLSITILITPKNLPILSPILSSNPSIQTLIFPFPSHPSIPPGVENLKDLGNHGNVPMMSALSKLHDPIIQWFASHRNPPVAILSDFFLGWTHNLARQLNIPRIVFFSSGAFAVDILNHLWVHLEDVEIGSKIEFRGLPGCPRLPWDHVPTVFRRYRESVCGVDNYDGGVDLIRTSMAANYSSWASVTNTFEALEDVFLAHMSELMGHSRVYSVGPLNMVGGPWSDDDVISWLDRWEDGSVLYVCFGSQKLLRKAQMEALAVGLERSGVQFVWVAKLLTAQQVADGYGSVPDGFEGRVSGRGFVVKGWAPQASILGHRAVGGFLSHCGWNSVLEAMMGGVMILGWPMEADQFVNAKLLVEYKGAAVVVCQGGETVPDSDELAWKIAESMRGDAKERVRAKELRTEALEAIKVGGSSNRDLDGLVQELSKLKVTSV
ncbi:UDP-glycosyltransferase 89a2 [Phtheirospermum japonicum]|uniref:UDP-glycosyltransferase 89a2 n=1 Tax=Phtheirospermum japonicum TaxID=374723 RepID=A0A830BQM7_9LAMI|nr:UDP-glycosyltransferase 89a2 [Phtheirospermum japonicum]